MAIVVRSPTTVPGGTMTISKELEAEILRLYQAERWKIGTISTQLGIHHGVVRRVLSQAGELASNPVPRPSMADPYLPFILDVLERHPTLRASRIYDMVVQRGYIGSPGHFRRIVARHRPRKPAEAYLRLRTLPGEQAQVDWASFGKVQVGQALRPLVAFVMVLSYSRRIFLRFYYGQAMPQFLDGHVRAFDYFGGVPRELLYDNLKSAVLERVGDAIRFNPRLLEMAAHYHFKPKPVAVARGNEKGRVERAIQYVRHAFYAAREWADLDDLNAQAQEWCEGLASMRPWPEDRSRTVQSVYETERPRLLPLPATTFPAEERVAVQVGKTPYVRFDLNDYSVPHDHVRRQLTLVADTQTVRILDGMHLLAEHSRSYDRGQQIEDIRHVEALVAEKRAAHAARGIDRLRQAAPSTALLLAELGHRHANLGTAVGQLLRLLDAHGAAALERAVAEAVRGKAFHVPAVRHALEMAREAQGLPPALPIPLPDDPRVRDLVVVHHPLSRYDQLHGIDPEVKP